MAALVKAGPCRFPRRKRHGPPRSGPLSGDLLAITFIAGLTIGALTWGRSGWTPTGAAPAYPRVDPRQFVSYNCPVPVSIEKCEALIRRAFELCHIDTAVEVRIR